MNELTVLIPTSGLGSRLGDLTEHTNKTLVRVGTKPVLTHIIEQYPADTHFLLMLGHKGELVREYMQVAHPDTQVTYLDLEMQEGNIGLVSAIRRQRNLIDGSFIFHASDTITIIPDSFLTDEKNMVLGYRAEDDVSQYRTIRQSNSKTQCVTRILDKGEMNCSNDLVHIGVARFNDVAAFWDAINELDSFDCDTHVINKMLSVEGSSPFQVVEVSEWWDTGNISKLMKARIHFSDPSFVLLEKDDQAVFMVGNRVVKFFSDPEMVSRRVQRGLKLGEAIPEIVSKSPHFFAYQKAEGTLARDTMYSEKFLRFLNWCEGTIWNQNPESLMAYRDNAQAFYWEKTLARLNAFYAKTGMQDRSDIINGEGIPPLHEMLEHIRWEAVVVGKPVVGMHGDLHFSNIMELEGGGFKLLDWRESFGVSVDYGDVYYDLGKLLHGLMVSHDLVEKNMFSIHVENQNPRIVTLDIMRHQRHVECEEMFKRWLILHDYNVDMVHLICALIFLNIAALHHHPYDLFLYFLGKRMIFDLLS